MTTARAVTQNPSILPVLPMVVKNRLQAELRARTQATSFDECETVCGGQLYVCVSFGVLPWALVLQIVIDAIVRGPLSRFLNAKDGKRFLRHRKKMDNYDKDASTASLHASMSSIAEALADPAALLPPPLEPSEPSVDAQIWDDFPASAYAAQAAHIPVDESALSQQHIMKRFDYTSGAHARFELCWLLPATGLSRRLPLFCAS